MRNLIKCFSMFLAVVCVFIFSLLVIGQFIVPKTVVLIENTNYETPKLFGVSLYSSNKVEASVGSVRGVPVSENYLDINLFNIIPVKRTNVKTVKRKYVVLGGEIFGIKLFTDGVLVVDTESVESNGKKISPADKAGIKVGDIIKSVNGETVYTSKRLSEIIEKSYGSTIKMVIVRNGKTMDIEFSTVKEDATEKYKAGLWVRDSTAGIGTVTYYNPENGSFGGLGHAICDVDTGKVMPMINGEMADAYVNGFYKSSAGTVGELCGVFTGNCNGNICVNCEMGMFGYCNTIPNNITVPVAVSSEVKVGEAEMICTIDKNCPKKYKIEIVKMTNNSSEKNKDMVIKITDSELLSKTGGILQGMSGSPIMQNGMLVGAVTHVFVSDPTQGYAIFVDKMLETSVCQEMSSYYEKSKAS